MQYEMLLVKKIERLALILRHLLIEQIDTNFLKKNFRSSEKVSIFVVPFETLFIYTPRF